MEKLTVERSIWIDAPRQRVWQAITKPEQIVQWFLPAIPGTQMTSEGGKLSVLVGPMSVDIIALEKITPPQQLTTRGLPDRLLTTTYTLETENGGTRLTVKMNGFELLAEESARERLEQSGAAWEDALQNLKAFVEGRELPFPYAAVSPLFGYWRKSAKTISVERSIWLAAPRQRVWKAITDPKEIEQWFSPGRAWRLSALEVGGRLSVVEAESGADTYVQTVEVVDAPRLFATRTLPEDGISYLSTWTLDEENEGTRLTLHYSGYELEPEAERQQKQEENTFGFGMMMENLEAYLEGRPLPSPGGF